MITFDALRFDVADEAFHAGRTPFLKSLIPTGWEERHSPGNFTFAAHAALFAGFWPTPARPEANPGVRPFALRFSGSRSLGAGTRILSGATIVEGLRNLGYYTVCIGGVGFFNRLNPLGSVFPQLFEESHWAPAFSVSELHSTRAQVRQAIQSLEALPRECPLFLFLNVSATHPPTHFYVSGARGDSPETQSAALEYVDRQLPPLFAALQQRGRGGRAFLMSDHGTLFGEDGLTGHRIAHPLVWNVPYAESVWESRP